MTSKPPDKPDIGKIDPEPERTVWCGSCALAGRQVPATTRSNNPYYADYRLCQPCADEYDRRKDAEGNWIR